MDPQEEEFVDKHLLLVLKRLVKARSNGTQNLLRIVIRGLKLELPMDAPEHLWAAVRVMDSEPSRGN
ncbi:hypothetical protein DL93DRAFT_2084747 [Clavulina sp. PMI_390]|nr:hypothetical protein DL93DRAFT_2084747 [Clavulina sp. PMI_390]